MSIERITYVGPWRLHWDIDWTGPATEPIEVFAVLIGISDATFWRDETMPQWIKNYRIDAAWHRAWESIEADNHEAVEKADATFAAIRADYEDLRREDAEATR